MSGFTEAMFSNAAWSLNGITTGEPRTPIRQLWAEVNARAARIAGGLASAGIGHGDAIAVLISEPAAIASATQAIWMRGASVTMLHPPGAHTDLLQWARATASIVAMMDARAVVVTEPFLAAAVVLTQRLAGRRVLTISDLLLHSPVPPVNTADDDLALLQLTRERTGSPKAVRVTHRNVESNAEAVFVGANVDIDTAVIVSCLACFHDMGMIGFLTVSMYFGAELIAVTPMEFLLDASLWGRLIDKYNATMTAAPNYAYKLLANRLPRDTTAGQFDLSPLRRALNGGEHIESAADALDLYDAGAPLRLQRHGEYPCPNSTVPQCFS